MSECQTKAGNLKTFKTRKLSENCNAFLTTPSSREFRVHRAGSQLKIKVFNKYGLCKQMVDIMISSDHSTSHRAMEPF